MKLFIILFILSTQAFAANWNINKDHTEVLFKVPFLGLSEVNGSFSNVRGKVVFENDFVEKIEILIASNSIYTGNQIRDGHLKGSDFFNSKKYPYIKFVSEKIRPNEDGSYQAIGKLSVANKTHDFEIRFEMSDGIADTWGYKNKFIRYKASLNREEFGLGWNKTLANNEMMVGNIIEIWGVAQIQPANNMTPSSHHMIPDSEQVRKREQLKRGEIDQEEITKFDIEEYDQALMNASEAHEKKYAPKVAEVSNENSGPKQIVIEQENYRDSLTWWLAYVTMGMIGFMAMIFLCIEGKILFFRYGKKKYEEIGFYGFLSDMVVTPILLLYVWAMWHLGYGV
jgi:polyisoprenoid-binding protein YceI